MKVRKLFIFLILFILFIPSKIDAIKDSPKVYMIIINKLTLDDIQLMDNLKRIASEGSIGLMNTRGVSGYTGAESFLTINSSRKATGNLINLDIEEKDSNIINRSIGRLKNLNLNNNYSPYIGAIGDNLHRQGLKTSIYGNSDLIFAKYRMSTLIPMDSKGLVDYGNISKITIIDDKYPFKIRTDFEKLLIEASNSLGDLVVVDTGDLDRLFRFKDNLTKEEYIGIRKSILYEIDNFIFHLSDYMNSKNSILLTLSPNSGDSLFDISNLTPIILWGESINQGVLYSPTTHRELIVSNIDLGPTIMNFFKAPSDNMLGNPLNSIEKKIDLNQIVNINKAINTTSRVRYNTLYYYGIFSIIILFISVIILVGKLKLDTKVKTVLHLLLRTLMIIPIILIIVSIFRPKEILSYLILLSIGMVLSIVILWATRNIENQGLYISITLATIIVLDLHLNNYISRYSVLSYDPIIGARYYGIGNEMVGLFLGALTIISTKLIGRSSKNILPLFLFIIAGLITGLPSLGANVGGSLAFLFVIIIFIIENYRKKLNFKKIVYITLLMIIVIFSIVFFDIVINKQMTHLGKSLIAIKNSSIDYVIEIIIRKLLMNIKLVGRSFWTYLLFLHILIQILLFYLREIDEVKLIGYMAGLAGIISGFMLNDSGLLLASIAMNFFTIELYLENLKIR